MSLLFYVIQEGFIRRINCYLMKDIADTYKMIQ